MPFDSITTRAVKDDLSAHLVGGRVDRVIQPADLTIALLMRAEQANHWLVLSAHAQQARVQRTMTKQASGFSEPSSWIMLLRKYLEGARLHEVRQLGVDRVLQLTFQAGPHESVLIAEMMGKYSNVILTDRDYMVLGALKHVHAQENRFRVTLPRHPYLTPPRPMQPPPHQDHAKLDPLRAIGGELAADFAIFPDEMLLWKALLDLVDGLSPTVAREVTFVVTGAVATLLEGHRDLDTATALLAAIRERFGSARGNPSAVWQGEKLVEYAAFPLRQYGSEPRLYPDIVALLDAVYAAEREPDALAHQRAALLARIEPQRKALRRKIASLASTLVGPEKLAALRTQGEMVLAYQHSIEQGQQELTIPELDLTIPLDPKLNPLENAQRLFKSYQKARDAAAVVPGLIEAAQQERDYLDQLAVHAELAADPASLAAVREEFREATTPMETANKKSKKQDKRKMQSRSGKDQAHAAPLRLRAADGTEILIGRSARQNDTVTFSLASPQDIWLHARQIPGAHVILRAGGRPPSNETLLRAAELAAYHSQARAATTVPVDYAPVRNVRRIKGGKPGLVHYSGETTLNVYPRG